MRILIADDHPVVRQGLRQMFADEADLTVVAEARNGQELLDLARRIAWDVAVVDYNMPGKTGLELLKELRRGYPTRPMLIMSMYSEDRYAIRALKAGAAGYLAKESRPGRAHPGRQEGGRGGPVYHDVARREAGAGAGGQAQDAAARGAFGSRVPDPVDDRLREGGPPDRTTAVPEPEHRQQLSHADPAKDEDEEQRRADAIRFRASVGGVIARWRLGVDVTSLFGSYLRASSRGPGANSRTL